MELVGRILDGSITYDDRGLEAVPSSYRINQDEKIEHLEAVPLFQGCTRRQLRAVARIAETYDAPAGTVVIRVGEPGEEFFLIVEGTARVHVSARKRLRLSAGDFFGEMSLLDGERRSASVVAETALRLLVIKRRDFAAVIEKVPDMARTMMATLSRRVRHAERALDVAPPLTAMCAAERANCRVVTLHCSPLHAGDLSVKRFARATAPREGSEDVLPPAWPTRWRHPMSDTVVGRRASVAGAVASRGADAGPAGLALENAASVLLGSPVECARRPKIVAQEEGIR